MPPEPREIKETLRKMAEATGPAPYIVFAGNRLAKYLWDHWAPQLRVMGHTWASLLRAMSETVDKALDWIMGRAGWEDYVEHLARRLEEASKVEGSRQKPRTRTLLDYMG